MGLAFCERFTVLKTMVPETRSYYIRYLRIGPLKE